MRLNRTSFISCMRVGPMKKRTVPKARRNGGNSRSLVTRNVTRQSERSHNRALHVLAAMRRDPKLSLSRAARLEGVKPETVKKHFRSSLRKIAGKSRQRKAIGMPQRSISPTLTAIPLLFQPALRKSESRQATISGTSGATCAARRALLPNGMERRSPESHS